ncbi:hypothetical protein RN001_009184 [Aquatica leii]|uniref:DUF4817 domain-containing protein n=1 Tax=Aquatica leii TaxID=1421715 RepID=A0AAN7QFX7_9COLE|nr:hypothetical protein RN001_009184 [Aquatica leii]
MEAYPGNHRAFCIRAYYRNGDSIVSVQRLYRAEFNVRNARKDDTIRKWIRMFENTGSSYISCSICNAKFKNKTKL